MERASSPNLLLRWGLCFIELTYTYGVFHKLSIGYELNLCDLHFILSTSLHTTTYC